ncbi:MAG: carbohydrate porin [Gemmataceae bacterium]
MTWPGYRMFRTLRRLIAAALLLAVAAGGAPVSTAPVSADQPDVPKEGEGKKTPSDKPEGAPAGQDKEKPAEAPKDEWYSIHAQSTFIGQANWRFHAPYTLTPLSLPPNDSSRNTASGTLFFDVRLWHGAELIFNPEFTGGTGLNGTTGIAGFPNGEATRTTSVPPTPYIARLFVRQTISLGGDLERVEPATNVLAGYQDIDRFTVTLGKYAASDVFDNNRYSHDPRSQFLDWSIMDNGAWDYPANTRGYTYGATAEFNTRYFAWRYGFFGEPTEANGPEIDVHFARVQGQIWETEERYELDGHPGRLRQFVYLNHANMGKYRDALALMPVNPDIAATRALRFKYGFGASLEQELATNLGAFLRGGWNDGQTETWAFTEIDQTISGGLLLKGVRWRRPKDETGIAMVFNGLSDAHRDYLAAGGLGFIVGDGRLNYGPEEILEWYYNCELREGVNVTADLQGVKHPAYNRDRGPVAIFALRVHLAF